MHALAQCIILDCVVYMLLHGGAIYIKPLWDIWKTYPICPAKLEGIERVTFYPSVIGHKHVALGHRILQEKVANL